MVERNVREGGKEEEEDLVANLLRNLQRNHAKVGEEEGEEGEVGEAQEEDLQRNLTAAEGDTGVTMEE